MSIWNPNHKNLKILFHFHWKFSDQLWLTQWKWEKVIIFRFALSLAPCIQTETIVDQGIIAHQSFCLQQRILLYVVFCTLMVISRQREAWSRNYALPLSNDFNRRQHCQLQAFEQFGALYMHNSDDKHPTQPGFETSISEFRATTGPNEPSGPACSRESQNVYWQSVNGQAASAVTCHSCYKQTVQVPCWPLFAGLSSLGTSDPTGQGSQPH